MAKDKKLVEDITPMSEDFAQWYTDVVKKAELMRYSTVKGCMMIMPNGYAIWENIQKKAPACPCSCRRALSGKNSTSLTIHLWSVPRSASRVTSFQPITVSQASATSLNIQ